MKCSNFKVIERRKDLMSHFARFRPVMFAVALCAGAVLAPAIAAQDASSSGAIPDFMAGGNGWDMINSNATDYVNPPSGPKPVTNDPKYPHIGNLQPGQKTDRVADLTNPILQDWLKESMKKTNDAVLRGRTPFVATSLCWPGGVPAQLLVPTAVYFIQRPNEILMIWERDMLTRHIYLNQPHSKDPKRSWFGESVGHYENGDTLVIDTIGFVEHPLSFVDNYRTPHTKDLHVVERWKITNGERGKIVEVSFTADDPGAFNMPWGGMMRYRHINQGQMQEFACAENNPDYFGLDDYTVPTANKPDF
jgi:hypothetical protein